MAEQRRYVVYYAFVLACAYNCMSVLSVREPLKSQAGSNNVRMCVMYMCDA